jgi:hypothetical protein
MTCKEVTPMKKFLLTSAMLATFATTASAQLTIDEQRLYLLKCMTDPHIKNTAEIVGMTVERLCIWQGAFHTNANGGTKK